jgi:hypothetical protein
MSERVQCPSCYGSGREGHGENCGCCGGSGEISLSHKRSLDIRNGTIWPSELTDEELLDNIPSRACDRWWYGRYIREIKRRLEKRKTSFTF